MRKIILIITIVNGLSSMVNSAKAQWTQLSSGTTNSLEELFFPASDTGYVVGENGTILKTVNGNSWAPLSIGSTLNLQDVFFLDTQNGFVVGDSGLFAKTIDGGNNWSVEYLNNANQLNFSSVCFTDITHGCIGGRINAVDGIIYKTIDGGINWTVSNLPSIGMDENYKRIVFPTQDTGYALTRGICLKTIDAGINWFMTDSSLAINGNMFSILEDAYFFSADRGYIVGWYNPFTGYTTNGGVSWSDDSLGQWFSIDFPSPLVGYMVGWSYLIKTIDGGATWDTITSPLIQGSSLYSMDFIDDDTGYICGSNGTIIKTINGGTTFIDENYSRSGINIYPNPASTEFQVMGFTFQVGDELRIVNAIGEIIYQKTVEQPTSTIKLLTSNVQNGLYFLQIVSNYITITEKVIIHH